MMSVSITRVALRARRRTAWRFAALAMAVAGISLVVIPSGPLKVVGVFVAGAVYGWGITHMLNAHQRKMDMRLVREAVNVVPPQCEGMCKRRTAWSPEQRTEHSEFHA